MPSRGFEKAASAGEPGGLLLALCLDGALLSVPFFFFFFLNKFICLFLAALGLRCCAQAFPSCSELGLLFVTVRGLLTVVASLVAERGLSSCGSRALECRLSSCGARA